MLSYFSPSSPCEKKGDSTHNGDLHGVRSGGPQEAITMTVWIKGLNTAGLVDRSEVKSPVPLKITGTRSYTKWSDKTTLFVLEPVVDNR